MVRKVTSLMIVGMFFVATITAIPTFASKDEIKIGVLMGLTGPWASIDGPAWNGIKLAVKQINDQGGLLGKTVRAICIDTKGEEAETIAAAHRLVSVEKVSTIVGYCDSHWVLAASPIAKREGIPFITPGATLPLIPEMCGAFLACFGDNAQAAAMAQYAYEDMGLRRVVVLRDVACDFSMAVTAYFIDSFEHFGGEIAYTDSFKTGDVDFSAQVGRLKSRRGVDGVYVGAIPDNCGLIVKQIREAGIEMPILGEDGFDTELLVKVGGEYAEDVVFATHVGLSSDMPSMVKFVEDYKKMFDRKPENAFAPLGYDAMNLLAQAIRDANSSEPDKIMDALESMKDFKGVTGTISYSPGQRVPMKEVSILKVENGKFELVKSFIPRYMPDPKVAI